MSAFLFGLGVIGALAGIAMIGFGIPVNEFSLGNTLVLAGTSSLMGGLVLIGLSAAVAQLQRIAEALAARPAPRPGRPLDMFEPPAPGGRAAPGASRLPFPAKPSSAFSGREPQPMEPHLAAAPSVDVAQDMPDGQAPKFAQNFAPDFAAPSRHADAAPVSAGEIDEAPLSPHAPGHQAPLNIPAAQTGAAQPRELAEAVKFAPPKPRGANGSGAARHEQPSDAPWPGAAPVERIAQHGNFEAKSFEGMWPTELRPGQAGDAALPASAGASHRGEPTTRLRPGNEPRAVAILKSGVVDGMGYTLYVDGSIEAELPQGTLRFGSINDLRDHLEKNS